MMKKSTLVYQLTLFTLILFCNSLIAQETEFEITNCGNTQGFAASCLDGGSTYTISVTGQGTMGVDNFGIVEAYFDIDQPNFFDSEAYLVAPDGQEFLLASAVEGINSFPQYSGINNNEILDVSFRNCASLPVTSANIEPSGLTFYPVDAFSSLNDGATSANGDWGIRFCTLDPAEYLEVFCASVTFGNLCPEITNANITPATCSSSSDGSVSFDHQEGACADELLVFSIDGINYQDGNTFNGLTPGDYTGYIAINVPSALLSLQGGSSSVEECITEFPFTIGFNDTEPPFLTDCPADQTVNLDEFCSTDVTIIDPIITDNCGNIPVMQAIITFPNGDSFDPGISGGNPYTFSISGAGVTTIEYYIEDEAGLSANCTTSITTVDITPPVWTNQSIIVNIECGVDDVGQAVQDNLAQLAAEDACGSAIISFDSNQVTPQCGNSEWNDWFYTVADENGNQSGIVGEILINVNDNTPPVISNVPDNVTINCDDAFPVIPQPGTDVFADDVCEGDLSSSITLSSTISMGDCTQGQAVETHFYTYTVEDGCGNVASEVFIVSVFNNEAPEWAITGTVSALQVFNDCEPSDAAQQLFYTYVAEDECGNQNFANVYFYYLDTQAPVLNGIPADVTINCNDDLPTFPTVTASDVCQGDVTADVEYDVSISSLSCDINQTAFIETHTWTISDACGNIQQAEWKITVFNDEAVALGDDITACVGETVTLTTSGLTGTYLWSTGETTSSITVGVADTYSVTVTGPSGCCSIDDVAVSYQNIPNASATGGTLDCSGDDITIMGSSTSTGVTYSWTGPGGYTSADQNPQVSQAGTYVLTVSTSAGCEATANAVVVADTNVPDISTSGGTIDCTTSEVTLTGSSNTSGVNYAWTGPNGYSSSVQNPTVSTTGDYFLTITAPNGCIAEGIAVVEDDTAIPTASATGGTIDCDNDMVTLMTTTSDTDATFSWSGPNGYSSTSQNPSISEAGTYMVTVLSDNGCSNTASATVDLDITDPNLTASAGEIDCNNTTVQLMASSTTSDVIYQWTGPNGYNSTVASPTVDQAGDYTITVESANGCTTTMTVTVTQNTTNPTVTVSNGEIDCINSSITLTPDATDGVTYAWTGPNGFASTMESPSVDEEGTYTIIVTSSNGCTATADATITEDTTAPAISVNDGLINCSNPSTQLSVTSTDNSLNYAWTGPDGFSSDEQNPSVEAPGTYNVTATGDNGCTTTSSVTITQDIAVPNASATGGELTCDANTVQISGASTTVDVDYSWTGPNDFSSATQNPEVGSPGTYTLIVTASNGCTASATVEVTADSELPNISATGGTLDCNTTEIELTGSSTTDNVSFNWTGPGGLDTDAQNPTVSEAGVYTLTVSSDNGCVSEAQVTVSLDNAQPTVIALGGEISCSQSMITLVGNSNNDVTYAWSGPGGYNSTDQNPEVSEPGEYTLTVTGENGCTNETTVMVTADAELPVAGLEAPEVDCDNNKIILTVATDQTYAYSWTFDGTVIATGETVEIDQAGTYGVEITADNGCSITLSYELDEDIMDVQADISTTDATSSVNGTASIDIDNDDNVVSILWDNGQMGLEATDLSVGFHTVTVTTWFGCMFTFEFEIKMSTSVEEIESLESFEVYPTVFQDRINVEAEFTTPTDAQFFILDNTGKVVKTITPQSSATMNETIDLYELSSGIYILAMQAESQIKTVK